jgi:hypothetical protein
MCLSLTTTAPVGRELQVDLLLASLAIAMKYSSQPGLTVDSVPPALVILPL